MWNISKRVYWSHIHTHKPNRPQKDRLLTPFANRIQMRIGAVRGKVVMHRWQIDPFHHLDPRCHLKYYLLCFKLLKEVFQSKQLTEILVESKLQPLKHQTLPTPQIIISLYVLHTEFINTVRGQVWCEIYARGYTEAIYTLTSLTGGSETGCWHHLQIAFRCALVQ